MNLQIDQTQVVVAAYVEENAPNIHRTFVLIIIEFEHMIIINKAYICAYVYIYNILFFFFLGGGDVFWLKCLDMFTWTSLTTNL